MRRRGRKPWWQKIWTAKGLRNMTEAEINTMKQPAIEQMADIEEWISSYKHWSRSEKLARLKSQAFEELRRKNVKKREDVSARNLRIHEITKKISVQGWLGKSNSWIASRLAGNQGRSVNTLRADVSVAKKFLMGSQNPKN
jgi:hypothetical protein